MQATTSGSGCMTRVHVLAQIVPSKTEYATNRSDIVILDSTRRLGLLSWPINLYYIYIYIYIYIYFDGWTWSNEKLDYF